MSASTRALEQSELRPTGLVVFLFAMVLPWLGIGLLLVSFGHGSKSRTPGEHPNPH